MRASSIPYFLGAVLILSLTTGPVLAQYPCSFAWNSLKVGSSAHDYTTPITAQPYQGPCMAFAIVAAMESMYELEHANASLSPNMSEAWIDYRTWGNTDWHQILQVDQTPVPEEACGNFAPTCTDEVWECHLNGQIKPITQAGNCFDISREYNETIHEWEWVITTQSPSGMSWYRAGNVDESLSIQDKDDLKGYIVNDGPVVLRVDGPTNISKFRGYNTTGVSYHAFSIIGWKDIGTCTQWLIKDSWPGMSGFAYTKINPGIPALLSSGNATAWQVSDISYQANTGGPITPAGTSWPSYNSSAQCVPPPGITGNLHCWNFGADKGGCMSAAGAMNGTSVSWQLNGNGGYLANTSGQCAEIVGANFTGTLTGTITDGCGRTATKSCYFAPKPGGGGGGPILQGPM